MSKSNKEIRVVELFAGVGGFRLGLEGFKDSKFKTIWANQWEPSTKIQHAADIYRSHFNDDTLVNDDISKVKNEIPNHDLLVGGFPCQDYSVAHGNKAEGIKGKKGVLWWEILDIVNSKSPKAILLENVDRLLKSPTQQRGRDFAIMLRALCDAGYFVEWMAINAADYGMYQKRRRVFIFAYKNRAKFDFSKAEKYIKEKTIFKDDFPILDIVEDVKQHNFTSDKYADLVELSDNHNQGKFGNIGIAYKGYAYSFKYSPKNTKLAKLRDILLKQANDFVYLNDKQIDKAKWTKENKKILRKDKETGFEYWYTEGQMHFPENLDLPGRTMLTSEGTINRSSHFIQDDIGIRFIHPIESERLNGFPDNWTDGANTRFRYFAMGNALVVDIIKLLGKKIQENHFTTKGK